MYPLGIIIFRKPLRTGWRAQRNISCPAVVLFVGFVQFRLGRNRRAVAQTKVGCIAVIPIIVFIMLYESIVLNRSADVFSASSGYDFSRKIAVC